MMEHRGSAPEHWCKYCEVFIEDTEVLKEQHDATDRHQANIRHPIQGLLRGHGVEIREPFQSRGERRFNDSRADTTRPKVTKSYWSSSSRDEWRVNSESPNRPSRRQMPIHLKPQTSAEGPKPISMQTPTPVDTRQQRVAYHESDEELDIESSSEENLSPNQRLVSRGTQPQAIRQMPQITVVNQPERNDEKVEQTLQAQDRNSVGRPPLLHVRSSYDTPQARIIVEGPRSVRRPSLQAHDRPFKEYPVSQQRHQITRHARRTSVSNSGIVSSSDYERDNIDEIESFIRNPSGWRGTDIKSRRKRHEYVEGMQNDDVNYVGSENVGREDRVNASSAAGKIKASCVAESTRSRSRSKGRSVEEISDDNGEIRFRIGNDAPVTLSLNGDMEGRTLQLVPIEDGMNELVISGNRHSRKSTYRSEQRSLEGERRALLSASQPRRDAEETRERDSQFSRSQKRRGKKAEPQRNLHRLNHRRERPELEHTYGNATMKANDRKTSQLQQDPTAQKEFYQRLQSFGGLALSSFTAQQPDDDSASVSSVFSTPSLTSTATDYSRASSYPKAQLRKATTELVDSSEEDRSLIALYCNALDLPEIESERLQQSFREMFETYAECLKYEATNQLESLASSFVSLRAHHLAGGIVAACNKTVTSAVRVESHSYSGVHFDEETNHEDFAGGKLFADNVQIRQLLIESVAFEQLRNQLKISISSEPTSLPEQHHTSLRQNSSILETSWEAWRAEVGLLLHATLLHPLDFFLAKWALFTVIDAFYLMTDGLSICSGLLEPPLARNATRLRWTNSRGSCMFSDTIEYRCGGIAKVLPRLEGSTGARVTAAPYNRQTGNQQYRTPHPIQWIRDGLEKLSAKASRPTGPCIPLHGPPSGAGSSTQSTSLPAQLALPLGLHLLACMHRDRSRKTLRQDPLENVNTDRQLFKFMHQQYLQHRGYFRNMLSFKSVTGIFFVKFNLPPGNLVIVRDHKSYCAAVVQSGCQCIPPKDVVEPSQNAQYRCVPGPPEVYPPIPSAHLADLFAHPDEAHDEDDWILKQLPRRICGKLQGQPGQPAEGWGVYYQESWDREIISALIFSTLLVASLLFGVLWSIFKFDVQGAFGVSAYMVAICAALIPLIAMWIDKPR